ncbi:hypothetical protein LG634_23220 [Streptomyces bambusae]|uniref:hypothetical protein n=1 Tax=Streptomyces bambusae TaxID=1550616 RepID=UPI001CFDDD32|nr:hypothetical protein [Streptomyces bambusae]MCB5167729.1 hypothetical protein [Streptomyces bambusae]
MDRTRHDGGSASDGPGRHPRPDVPQLLRQAAAAHRPDRTRMLARIEHGMTATPSASGDVLAPDTTPDTPRRRPRLAPRVVLATLATATTLLLSALAVGTVVRDGGPQERPAAGPATPPHPPAGSPAPARPRSEDGPLTAAGALDPHGNRYWAQSNLTLETRETLRTLTLELRVRQTGGVASTGSWQTRPAADFTLSVRRDGPALVYRWTLRPGRTVPPGSHVFAAQYNHAEGVRDASGDTYRADARTTAPGAKAATVRGGFAPAA